MAAFSARARARMPSRSAPTATISAPYDGSAQASIRVPRLDPVPLTSTTRRAGSGGTDTFGRLFDSVLWHAPPVIARSWPMQSDAAVPTVSVRLVIVAVVAMALAALHLPYR